MPDQTNPEKPKTVLHAEYALWTWTAWMCLFGIYQSWLSIPEVEAMITGQLEGVIAITPATMLKVIIVGYVLLAATSAWVVFKIGAGKNWARTSLLLGFFLDIVWSAWPPYHGVVEHLPDIPDLGLQTYALYLLYSLPGKKWFSHEKRT